MSDSTDKLSRNVLPIPSKPRVGLITYDAKDPDTQFAPISQLRPPKGAPNVLVILIDDAGYGSSSAFGGPCQTPNAEKLAAGGLRYRRFHTTALCSPTRQALLTGRNHHSVGMGAITEIATGAPGYSSVLRNTAAPLAKTLKLNGYNTAQFGKCHEVPVWQTSPVGPFDQWPTGGGGFEYFYGFIGGEMQPMVSSALRRHELRLKPEKTPEEGYHLIDDMTDKAIKWVGQQKMLAPDKPFFVYFAPGATHAPHHVPKEWADKYKGKFDQGWDKVREETFARQKKIGVIPPDCELTDRHKEIPAWDDMPEDLKPILRRQMEVYAGFLEYTDHHVGRLIDALAEARHPRRHADLLHHRRQWRVGRGYAQRHLQRNAQLQRLGRLGDAGVSDEQDRQARRADFVQPLCGRVGARDGYAIPVDQAGRVALWRDAQWHDRALAEPYQEQGREPRSIPPCDRCRADDPRSGWFAAAGCCRRGACRRRWKASACFTRSTTPKRPISTRPNILRCSAIAAFITAAGPR